MVLVNSTKGGHRVLTFLVGVAQIKGKDGLIDLLLVQHVVERRNNLVDGDGVKAQSQDTVESTKGKSKTRLAGCFGELLVLELQIPNLDGVFGNKATQTAGSISDLELAAVLLECGGRRRVVLAVEVAGDRATLGRRHPQVGATSVKDNLELLGRGTDFDLGEV